MSFLRKNILFLFPVITICLLFSLWPFLYHRQITPPDRVYLGAERYTPDYYVYLFYLKQGALGRWNVVDFYTNEPHAGSLVHIEYLLMGKAGSVFNLSVQTTYYLFRSLFLAIFLFTSFWFIGLFLQNKIWHRLTFLLSIFWGGFFWPELTKQGLSFKTYFDFYQTPDLFNRLTFEPHKLIGMSLLLIILYLFQTLSGKRSVLNLAGFLILLIFGGLLHGVTAISLIAAFSFYLLLKFIIFLSRNKNRNLGILSRISKIGSIGIIGNIYSIGLLSIFGLALPLLYWQWVFSQNHVWYAVSLWERHFAAVDSQAPLLPTVTGSLFMLGPLILLSIIGIKKFLQQHRQFALLLISVVITNLVLFFAGYIFLGTTKHRYHQVPYLVIWSILAGYGIMALSEKFSAVFKLATRSSWVKIAPMALILFLLFVGIPNARQGLNRQLNQFGTPPNLDLLGYPPKDWYDGFVFLHNTPPDSVILSSANVGQIIPAFPGRRVVIGDYVHTYHYFDKLPVVTSFFNQQQDEESAAEFLKSENVSYVISEQNSTKLEKYSSLLKPVYQNGSVTIYKTNAPKPKQ